MSGIRTDLSFTNPTLNKVTFKVNKDFDEENFTGIDNLNYNLTLKEKNNDNKEENSNEEVSTLVIFELNIGEQNKNDPFLLSVEYQAEFKWSNKSNLERESFLKINAASILYSYCRPIIHNITGLSEFPPLNLPFYNFTNKE